MSALKSKPSVLSPNRSRTSRRTVAALLFFLPVMLPGLGRAQAGKVDTVSVPGVPAGQVKAAHSNVDTTAFHPTKSPGKAMLLSAILPGSGQFYNESYWKVPIVVGFGVYLVYNWIDNNKLYKDYRSRYEESVATNPPNGDQTLLNNREFYKDQRDSFTWYLLIWYFVTLVDAYVDASLYDFNVGSDLSLQTLPVLSPVPVRAIQLNVHIGF